MTPSWPLGALVAALLLLGACAGPLDTVRDFTQKAAVVNTPEERAELTQIVVEDLQEARRSAQVHGDVLADQCWSGLLRFLEGAGEGFFTDASKGAFSAFQKTRNTRRFLTGDGSALLQASCAALKEDSRSAVVDILQDFGLPIPGVLF